MLKWRRHEVSSNKSNPIGSTSLYVSIAVENDRRRSRAVPKAFGIGQMRGLAHRHLQQSQNRRQKSSALQAALHRQKQKKEKTQIGFSLVVPPGIEPGTQGFSVLCSTNWAMAPSFLRCKDRYIFSNSKFSVIKNLFCLNFSSLLRRKLWLVCKICALSRTTSLNFY